MSININQEKNDQKDANISSDEKTKNKIDKHLTDINDQISEDDIKNVNTNIGSATSSVSTAKDEKESDESVNDKGKDEDEGREPLPTSYNILGS